MSCRVVGALTMASIVLGFAALDWALHGAMAFAWVAFALGVLGVGGLLACLCTYVFTGVGDARPEQPQTGFAAARTPHHRAPDRPWLREPTVAGVRPAGLGASMSRPIAGQARSALEVRRTAPRG